MKKEPNENQENICPLEFVQHVIGGKWKISILWALSIQTRRFNELQRLFPNITQAMLTKQLRELERDRFIRRKVYREVPPKVEYSLTPIGKDFFPIIKQMYEWGEKNYDVMNAQKKNPSNKRC
ncbi:DNA-binding transcriptional regulator, HxlR family [Evansella caseinilytica]|uniref:DNA-binding transcriptional regulator, HxlR family n=1 Tax=Evansella caseinilytica TaxID=1503961 RepID=A0A1H3G612_9BACI|nr:helix-turn-helix domain-containing protein [Evansella caseinilytica]SDX98487.1 DNA-binding transcriptional regulator, HxlR family [Evansella caseinilytica]